jgi:RPA family protein
MYLAGVLTEVVENGDIVRCRIADPTGAFAVVTGGKNSPAALAIQKLPVPSFLAVSGYAQIYQKNQSCHVSVRPEHVREIDRVSRDNHLLITAEYTLNRLDQLNRAVARDCTDEQVRRTVRHYGVTIQTLRQLANMVEAAIQNVRLPESPTPSGLEEVRSAVLEMIQKAGGPRGIAVEEILDTLSPRGIQKEAALAALESLILEDECYQPQKGYVKLL